MNEHRSLLWNISYRMLGSADEADEVVQECFLRALEHPPQTDRPLRPWLVKVSVNLARDRLRVRRRQPYPCPWLPQPVPDELLDRQKGAGYALLVAMERLTPTQRAVWLLREVFEYSVEETAELLTMSPSNVKVTLHRARQQLGELPEACPPSKGMEILTQFLGCIAGGDVAGALALLTEDVVLLNDGGGRYAAAGIPLVGAERVVRTLLNLQKRGAPASSLGFTALNGEVAFYARRQPRVSRDAPVYLLFPEIRSGRIAGIYILLATAKLPDDQVMPERWD
ncbi:MAG TPA: sigma-70 family RNA polymerase sigma factor [Myxococcota bacterium]|nr:sigma-70 family RNA polymerase sigma factor [Myxococcota bacterium]